MPEFLEITNEKFGKEAAISEDAHREMRTRDNLERIFARKETRKLSKNLTFQYKGTLYMLQTKTPYRLRHATVDVLWSAKEEIKVEYKGKPLEYKKWSETIYEQPRILDSKELEGISWTSKQHSNPRRNHPWR